MTPRNEGMSTVAGSGACGSPVGPASDISGGARLGRTVAWPLGLAAAGAIAFRLPELKNPGIVNSDSAVVGLQALHVLRGEWAWFLWGSGYQTSVDSVVAAGFFLLGGATPLVLMLSALSGHVLVTWFALLTLRRHYSQWTALGLVLPLVLSSAPTHTYTLHPPRQAALTLVFAAIWLLDGAAQRRRAHLGYALGAALGALACFADPYALVFAPGLALLGLLAAHDRSPSRSEWIRRSLWAALGGLAGSIPLVMLRLRPDADAGPLTLTRQFLARNVTLLTEECLPWILGSRVLHQPSFSGGYELWRPPWGLGLVEWIGAALLGVALATAGAAMWLRRMPWEIRRLGLMATVTAAMSLVGFLLSVMPMDRLASRYLVALVLVAPFALAVPAWWLSGPRVIFAMLPIVVSSAVSGWVGFEPLVRGLAIVDAGWEADEARLLAELERRGIRYAVADYWAAYRLTFMFRERVIVVPTHASQDRYPAYREAFLRAPRYAYLYDRSRSGESEETVDARTREEKKERFGVGSFDAYIMER
jgi:hypothetical protein